MPVVIVTIAPATIVRTIIICWWRYWWLYCWKLLSNGENPRLVLILARLSKRERYLVAKIALKCLIISPLPLTSTPTAGGVLVKTSRTNDISL
ncbi:hypothetical protein EV426DRAFT_614580 [Tirmania nivea]|nr:hypothetical protein EV426DRAFT_614580 [Tirmania nivea]